MMNLNIDFKALIATSFSLLAITGCQTTQTSQMSVQVESASHGDDLFYSYAFKTSDLYQPQTMQAIGGKLVYRNDCLQLFNGSTYVTPIFPNAVTTFDQQTQTLKMLQVTFNMQDMIMAGGYQTSSKNYLSERAHELVTQAPKRCLLDEIMLLSGIPTNMGKVDDGLND